MKRLGGMIIFDFDEKLKEARDVIKGFNHFRDTLKEMQDGIEMLNTIDELTPTQKQVVIEMTVMWNEFVGQLNFIVHTIE